MEVLQIPGELERMVALYAERKPRRVLEIGCWDGGTLREWLTATPPPELVVAVSLEHRQPGAYPEWTHPDTTLIVATGDSVSPEMVAVIEEHAPYDWAFIDGEHSYPYVSHDVAVVMPLMRKRGVLLLHDVTPEQGHSMTGPLQLFRELEAAGHRVEVFDSPAITSSAGIGVVYV